MSYVYHRIPVNMEGDILYPMNRLAEISLDLYRLYKQGYEGREILLERKIPHLDCLWNDVLHCSPVHPSLVAAAMREEGLRSRQIPEFDYFEIDAEKDISIDNAVVFYRPDASEIEFRSAKEVSLPELNFVPEFSRAHYRRAAETGESLFPYHGIPHFLYQGTLETKHLKRIHL